MNSHKGNFAVLAAGFSGMVFFGVSLVVMGSVLPSLIEKFSLDTAGASTIAGLLPLGLMLGSLVFGPVVDRYGYKKLLIAATLAAVFGMELLAFAPSVSLVRIAIFFIGLGGGILNGLTSALISDASSDKARASNLSILGVFYTVGAITIPLIFASLKHIYTYTHIVSAAGVIMACSVLYYLFVKFPEGKFEGGFPVKKMLALAKEPAMLLLAFTLFLQSGAEGLASNWIPSFLEKVKGFSSENALYALSFMVFGMGTGRILLGVLLRIFSKSLLLTLSMTVAAAGITIVGLTSDNLLVSVGTFLTGMGSAATFPVVFSVIGDKFREVSGTAFSFALTIALIGNTLINLMVGVLGLSSLTILIAAISLAVPVIFYFNTKYIRSKN